MASYTAPGVYMKDKVAGTQTISQASASVGILIGQARMGLVGQAQKIGSWTEYISKYANGLDTPFMEDSFLPYAVYGFFTNGGKELYVGNLKKNAVCSKVDTSAKNQITAVAASEGVWGNDLSISVVKSADWDASENPSFDVEIALGVNDSVTIADVTLETIVASVLANTKAKSWIKEFSIGKTLTELQEETVTLAGGSEGDELKDADYIASLSTFIDVLDDVTMVGVPGQTSKVMNDAIMSYCDNNWKFPFLDMPLGSTVEAVKMYRKSISAFTGLLAYPWGKVYDPLTDGLKLVPTCGNMMGLYARTIENRGVHKAPAGTEAQIRGFVETELPLTQTNLSTLNPIGVVCIMSRPNAGIVSWGARSLNSTDTTLRYVSDGMLNLNIKKSLYDGTQWAVFEPNDAALWTKVGASCRGFLEGLRLSGALKGDKDEAYYVTVDDTNNTDDSINNGELNIEVGYAPVKPAEFVIIHLAHSIESNS